MHPLVTHIMSLCAARLVRIKLRKKYRKHKMVNNETHYIRYKKYQELRVRFTGFCPQEALDLDGNWGLVYLQRKNDCGGLMSKRHLTMFLFSRGLCGDWSRRDSH